MKSLKITLSAFAAVCFVVSVHAQSPHQSKLPKWLPENGNWMVETKLADPHHAIIYFYTNEGTVIYKETLDGVKLNLDKKKVKMRLKKVLNEALIAWNKDNQVMEDKGWVVAEFKNSN